MKTAFSINAFTNYSLLDSISHISKIGFFAVEIVVDEPHSFLPLKKSYITEIKKHLKKTNLRVSNINANTVLGWHTNKKLNNLEKFEPSLSTENYIHRKWRIDYTKMAIKIAYELESPSICLTSGILNKNRKEKQLSFFENSLNDIAEFAEKYDIKIALEYEPGLLIGSSNDIFSIVSKYKNVGLNLDTCHAAVLGENISEIITFAQEKLFHIHFSDCKNKVHYHLLPGNGDIDFKNMCNALEQIGYDGYLTAELYTYSSNPIETARYTLTYLDNLTDR